jgi:hypothetical protein
VKTAVVAVCALLAWGWGREARANPPVAPVGATVDGEARKLYVVSVTGEPTAGPEDLLVVGTFVVPRGTEPSLRFETSPGRLLAIAADGKKRVVAAVAGRSAVAPGEQPDPEEDTIAGLSDTDLASLRCVRVLDDSEAVAKRLAKVDATTCCFVAGPAHPDFVTSEGEDAVKTPRLPAGTRYLFFDVGTWSTGPKDVAALATYGELRVLTLGRADGTTDLTPLKALRGLRYLDLGGRRLAHPEVIGGLASLRVLDAGYCGNVHDLEFARSLPELRVLNVYGVRAADLAPLGSLTRLRHVNANQTAIRAMPTGPFPVLEELRILSVEVPPAEVESFRAAHPRCRVVWNARDVLAPALEGVTKVRVRSGGTCHRREQEEKTLAELTKPEEIREFFTHLTFDTDVSWGSCMCCGDPTFELYVGADLRSSLGFHHGRTLRWLEGEWPGDAVLSRESQDYLCSWLVKRGVSEPAEELRSSRAREDDHRRRTQIQRRVLGDSVVDSILALDKSSEREEEGVESGDWLEKSREHARKVVEILRTALPDTPVRAAKLLRLSAKTEEADSISAAATELLRETPPDVLMTEASKALDDDEGRLAVGVWLLSDGSQYLAADQVDRLLPRTGLRVLSDPDPNVRSWAIYALRSTPRPAAIDLLRRIVREGRVLTTDPARAKESPLETQRNLDAAMVCLLQMGDRELIPKMREIAATWTPEQRESLENWIEKTEKGWK